MESLEESTENGLEKGRSVSLLLGMGIFFIPIIFAWFTLRKGHTTNAKAISFLWLAAFAIVGSQDGENISSEVSSSRSSLPPPVKTEQIDPDQVLVNSQTANIQKPQAKQVKVMRVSDFDFTMNEQPAVSIVFGVSDARWCDLTLNKSNVLAGFIAESNKRDNVNLSIECNWDGKYYIESGKHPTYSKVEIGSIDKDTKTAEFNIAYRLVDFRSDTYVGEEISLQVTNDNFINLIN